MKENIVLDYIYFSSLKPLLVGPVAASWEIIEGSIKIEHKIILLITFGKYLSCELRTDI